MSVDYWLSGLREMEVHEQMFFFHDVLLLDAIELTSLKHVLRMGLVQR